MSLLSDHDLYLFNEGTHILLFETMGAHPRMVGGKDGTNFAVWAPNAELVTVMGSFNGWDVASHPLSPLGNSGIWEGFVPGVGHGTSYKYNITSRYQGHRKD